jgi:hypothetical protein
MSKKKGGDKEIIGFLTGISLTGAAQNDPTPVKPSVLPPGDRKKTSSLAYSQDGKKKLSASTPKEKLRSKLVSLLLNSLRQSILFIN